MYACTAQVIKAYPEGKMSRHIHSLAVGDSLEIKGPMSKLPYTPNMKEKIGMVSLFPLSCLDVIFNSITDRQVSLARFLRLLCSAYRTRHHQAVSRHGLHLYGTV